MNNKFIHDNETITYQLEPDAKKYPRTAFYLTDEYLYVSESVSKDTDNLHIIKKSQITAVCVNTKTEIKRTSICILFAILIILVGIIVPLMTNDYLFFIILAVGIIVLIVGLFIGRPKYQFVISIYMPNKLNFNINNISPDKLTKLQYELLK